MGASTTTWLMSYRVRVWDNYEYMDESAAYDEGTYASYAEALEAAKKVVRKSLEWQWRPGFTVDQLVTQYVMYGEDPGIICDGPSPEPRFSARDYANELYEEVCRSMALAHERGGPPK